MAQRIHTVDSTYLVVYLEIDNRPGAGILTPVRSENRKLGGFP